MNSYFWVKLFLRENSNLFCYVTLGLQEMHFASKTPSMNAEILADFSCQVVAEQCILVPKNKSMPKLGFRIHNLNVNKV